MRGLARCVVAMGLLRAAAGGAQEAPGAAPRQAERAGGEQGAGLNLWAWGNFAILAGAIGYGMAKKAGPFFTARSQQIRRGIAEADELRAQAEARAAEVDRQLANLSAEVEALRGSERSEQAAEAERIRQQTAADLARIQEHAERGIAAAARTARLELKRHSARLALELAEEKIRARMTPESQDALLENFVRDLEHPAAPQHPDSRT